MSQPTRVVITILVSSSFELCIESATAASRWREIVRPRAHPRDSIEESCYQGVVPEGFALASPEFHAKLRAAKVKRSSGGQGVIDFQPGQFYGAPQFGASGGAFDIRALVASGAEHDIHVHTHDDAHFILVVSGVYISTARGASDFVQAPALIFNPPGTTHRDRFVKGIGTFIAISLRSATFRNLRDVLPLANHALQLRSVDGLTSAFRIARELRQNRDSMAIESMAWELLTAAAAPPCRIDGPASWALSAYEAIMDRATEPSLDVGDVAAEIGVHPVHLARVFRAAWGCSPGELLRWRRVDRAAEMLRRSDISGAQIAAEVGFVDQSHMTRAFRATYGVAPGVYRRDHVSRIQASTPTSE